MKIWYECELCGEQYMEKADCEKCEAHPFLEPPVQIGDLVVVDPPDYGSFGWFNGDENWVIKKPFGLHAKKEWDQPNYTMIYAVTAISEDKHTRLLHLWTKGMNGVEGHTSGVRVLRPDTHWSEKWKPNGIWKIDRPDLDGSDLIGKRARWEGNYL